MEYRCSVCGTYIYTREAYYIDSDFETKFCWECARGYDRDRVSDERDKENRE